MKVNDIILVIENRKGTEVNYLLTFGDYFNELVMNNEGNYLLIAEQTAKLEATKRKRKSLCELYFAPNKSIKARYCFDARQLQSFLWGVFNKKPGNVRLEEEKCSRECLEAIKGAGLDVKGNRLPFYEVSYEKLEKKFVVGEVYRNLNGNDYRLMEKFSFKNMLFMDVNSGNFVVGIGTGYYAKFPSKEDKESDYCVKGIEWNRGVYLGNVLSEIDFQRLSQEYGIEQIIKSKEEYRKALKDLFFNLEKIVNSKILDERIRKEAQGSMYQHFYTGKKEVFLDNLYDGKYDGGYFRNNKEKERELVEDRMR